VECRLCFSRSEHSPASQKQDRTSANREPNSKIAELGKNPFVGPSSADHTHFPGVDHVFDDVQDDTMNMSDADGERTLEWSVDTMSHLHQGPDFSFHNQGSAFSVQGFRLCLFL
jgi:hypothetical protein